MITVQMSLVLSLVLCLAISGCHGGILDCRNPGECAEKRMHPDLKVSTDILPDEAKQSYWLESGEHFVADQLAKKQIRQKAKNVIFFIGDGMSLTTLAATRMFLGGEEKQLSFEKFPHVGLSKTYAVDRIVPDSASTATAYLCGVKGNYNTIGVNGHVQRSDCEAMADPRNHVSSIAKWALDAGKSAGLVTTTRVTHASPAGVYANTAHRNWENDSELKLSCPASLNVTDIAYQLVYGDVGRQLKVIMGGGKQEFRDPSFNPKGLRSDGRDLISEWRDMAPPGSQYVKDRKGLLALDTTNTTRLLGLFHSSHMLYHVEDKDEEQPTLEQMTQKAIEVMQNDDKGYFLFIEGGKIDMAHHETRAQIALDETVELSKAVEMARSMTSEEDTLIVVSSDHSHTMTISGYPQRHANVLGAAGYSAGDDLPYLVLSYANGRGFDTYFDTKTNKRIDPTTIDKSNPKARFPATVPLSSETHGGEDVGVFASGPWSHLFTGVYEQNTLPHLMAYAMCVGDGLKACD